MVRVITINVNGIRAAQKKGMFEWLEAQNADVICLQEVRADMSIVEKEIFQLKGYHCYYQPAEKKGYSGVGIFSRQKPDKIVSQLGFDLADREGRYLHLEFGKLKIVSLYLPSGTSGDERQALKYNFMDHYLKVLKKHVKQNDSCIVCGDWNIAHKEIDLKNWKPNQKNSGFLPAERAWLDQLFGKVGFVDAFREVDSSPDQYTWWSNRGRAWDNNVGWRIDYQIVTPDLAGSIKEASIYKAQRFSDHAPLIVDYDIEI